MLWAFLISIKFYDILKILFQWQSPIDWKKKFYASLNTLKRISKKRVIKTFFPFTIQIFSSQKNYHKNPYSNKDFNSKLYISVDHLFGSGRHLFRVNICQNNQQQVKDGKTIYRWIIIRTGNKYYPGFRRNIGIYRKLWLIDFISFRMLFGVWM